MMNAEKFAIGLMLAQGALFAGETAAIHHLGPGASVMQLALIRAAAGVMLAFVMAGRAGFAIVRTRQLRLQLLRGAVTLLYMWVMIYSFGHIPFADATAISYTQAAYIALFSVVVLGETVTGARWSAAIVGIVGALLIAKPAFGSWNVAYLIAFVGAGLNGLAFVLNRFLQREDSQPTTMFYTNLIPLLGNLPILLMAGAPARADLVWLPAIFVLGPLGMYAGIAAVRHASAAMLGPYTLVRLVIALLGGAIVFGESPGIVSLIGALLIIASCVMSTVTAIDRWLPSLRTVRFPGVSALDPNVAGGD